MGGDEGEREGEARRLCRFWRVSGMAVRKEMKGTFWMLLLRVLYSLVNFSYDRT